MTQTELGQRLAAKIDGLVSTITRSTKGQYAALGEKRATVHYRKGGEEVGIRIHDMPVLGHSGDIVHFYEHRKLTQRFKMGNPPEGVEQLSAEEVFNRRHSRGGMEN